MKCFTIAALALFAIAAQADELGARSSDAAAIRALYVRYDAAWNNGDAATLAGLWAADAGHMEPDGRIIAGRSSLQQHFAQRFAGELKGTQSRQHIEAIRFLTTDVAVVDASYEVSGARDAEGHARPPLRGRYVDIWVRKDRTWRIAIDRPIAAGRDTQ